MDCLFCKIIAGEIPSAKVYEDEYTFAFRDIHPQAPVHVLIVPKKHMANALECDAETAGHLIAAAQTIARMEGVDKSGFRLISNCGDDACQSVHHLHVHLLGGVKMKEEMN